MTRSFPGKKIPIEDRIEQLSRLALAMILIITLGLISLPRGQSKKPQEGARNAEAPRPVARPGSRPVQ
jgi:hypothetical protein